MTMKESEIRKKPAEYLEKFVGIKEGSTAHKSLINTFNKSGLCKRYTMTTKDAWCATAVSASFIATGLAKIFPCVECSCLQMAAIAKRNKIWVEDDSYMPKVGDVVLYDWQDSGRGDCQGTPDHVGIVAAVNRNTFKIIEGNYSDTVKYRTLERNGRYIRGFITPNYSLIAKEVDNELASEIESAKTGLATNYDEKLKGIYKTIGNLNVRSGAGTSNKIVSTLSKGEKVQCYGYYSLSKDKTRWLYVACSNKGEEITGFCSSKYLKFVKK